MFFNLNGEARKEISQIWHSLLAPGGHLLGIFSLSHTSEWEIRELLKKRFDFLYWTRWKTSVENRLGNELVVYAKRKS